MSSVFDNAINTTFNELNKCHSVFHNQPPYTHYNKSFDNADALSLCLNSIHPYYVEGDQKTDQLDDGSGGVLRDPRTRKQLTKTLYDHTTNNYAQLFRSNVRSRLSQKQHTICLRAFLALQEQSPLNSMDLNMWQRTSDIRAAERTLVQQAALDYATNRKELMYAPAKRLVDLYKQWYARKVQFLLEQEADTAFNTHSGLPHVRVCKGFSQPKTEVAQVRLLARAGSAPVLCEQSNDLNFRKLHHRLTTYMNNYCDVMTVDDEEHLLRKEINNHFSSSDDEHEDGLSTRFFIPLESLLFLLVAGEYIDLPTELLLDINSNPSDETKFIIFRGLLPARQCGWHTHNQVVAQAFGAFSSVPGNRKWLRLSSCDAAAEPILETEEIDAWPKSKIEFKPIECDQYMESFKANHQRSSFEMKTNKALVKWRLKESETEKGLDVYTTLEVPPAREASGGQFFGAHTIKVEYKPEFGCEVMTKYELLKLWLQMTLLPGLTAADFGICSRIILDDFDTLLEERVTLARVEQQLHDMYHIDMSKLLANLAEFLQLLSSMAVGKYLLRYNPKFVDKLMLCSPAEEITQNTIFLHALLKSEPSDLYFTAQPHYLPIAEDLCTNIHKQRQMLPCSFRPNDGTSVGTQKSNYQKNKSQKASMRQQRQESTKPVKKSGQQSAAKAAAIKKRNSKRTRRAEKKRAEATIKNEDDEDLKADQILFGF